MATRELWAGLYGPYLFDEGDLYPDAVAVCGPRSPQAWIEDAPTTGNHVVRLADLDTAQAFRRHFLLMGA
jgi:hypothetical protein